MAEYPKLMDHILAVYDRMEEQAIDRNGDPIWEGKSTALITQLGLSNNYYTPIFRYLTGGNYVTQIRRGGGGSSSAYQLNARPDPNDFDFIMAKSGASNTKSSKALKATGDLIKEVQRLAIIVDQHSRILATTQAALLDISTKVNGAGTDPFAKFTPVVTEDDEDEVPESEPEFNEPDFEGLAEDGNV